MNVNQRYLLILAAIGLVCVLISLLMWWMGWV